MSIDTEVDTGILEDVADVLDRLSKDVDDMYTFRNLFFENHPLEMANQKSKFVEEKKDELIEKFESIDVDTQIPFEKRAEFLYIKGRCYNVSSTYDARATQCLSKAVKLNPRLVSAWNELGDCYLKNMNVKEAKASFEGALKHERCRVSLRCLSVILRQENVRYSKAEDAIAAINRSVELAKEAVAQDTKDGMSWVSLGNAYLCQFFVVTQKPATMKLCLSAYRQAALDPIAKGQPDLYYNRGIILKYEERYGEALEDFGHACELDPTWQPARRERERLARLLAAADQLVRTRGKLRGKRLTQMAQNIDKKMLGPYSVGSLHKFGREREVGLEHATLDTLQEGENEAKVVIGNVVGSIFKENAVTFTFAIIDESLACVLVTVYNWANGRGVIIGDTVTIPEPVLRTHTHDCSLVKYDFKSIRVQNPMTILVNGKRISMNQFAFTQVSSTYEIQ